MYIYVDDLIEKLVTRSGHLDVLAKIFDRLEQYKVKLNPKKCIFDITLGKLMEFIVSHQEIEVHPTKVKPIMEMPPPTKKSQIQSLEENL